jgi:NTE family protein
MPSRALVLGGGGPVGVAWESGLVAGLDAAGLRLADAGLIVGTSAGAIVGSQIALGRPLQELVAVQRALAERPPRAPVVGIDTQAITESLRRWLTASPTSQETRAEIGAFALAANTMTEGEALAGFGSMPLLAESAWPDNFVCTAVDALDGVFVTWDATSGVSLALAVASSCAVPGLFPPVTINSRRYMDGGMRSMTNADLAKGHETILIIAVAPAIARASEYMRLRIESEIEGLRAAGSRVEIVLPDDAALAAFGPNLMDDSSRRALVVEAGLRQGAAEAPRLLDFWRS